MLSIRDPSRRATRLGARARAPLIVGAALALLIALAVVAFRPPAGPGRAAPAASAAPASRPFPSPGHGSPRSAASSPGGDARAGITARLRQILRVREEAFGRRDMRLLETVYTADCPCLRSGRAAIARLRLDGAVWRGRAITVEVTGVERLSERVWVAVVLLSSRAFRIEREGGGLIRTVPAGRWRYRFVLARPAPGGQWLVGDASLLGGGGP